MWECIEGKCNGSEKRGIERFDTEQLRVKLISLEVDGRRIPQKSADEEKQRTSEHGKIKESDKHEQSNLNWKTNKRP